MSAPVVPSNTVQRKLNLDEQERVRKRMLGAGGTLLLLGLALVGTGPSDVGMVVCLVALLVVIGGIHAFGRLGPDEGGRLRPPRTT